MNFIKPKIMISKCLEFEACRYDGQMINNQYIQSLKEFIDFIPICPEVEIGMGTPRDPIRIVDKKNVMSLYQESTGKDYAKKMNDFSNQFLKITNNIDGFLLKANSPSCAISTSKIYPNKETKIPIGKGSGLFTSQIIKIFPDHPKEEEKRFNNIFLREHFLTSIFTIADYKSVTSIDSLYKFHAKHKYLFMTYNQTLMRKMGKIASNNRSPIEEIIANYYDCLLLMFKRKSRYTSNINTQMHIFGYFKKDLSQKDKKIFLDLLGKEKKGDSNIKNINKMLYSWAIKFDKKYLIQQSYLNLCSPKKWLIKTS